MSRISSASSSISARLWSDDGRTRQRRAWEPTRGGVSRGTSSGPALQSSPPWPERSAGAAAPAPAAFGAVDQFKRGQDRGGEHGRHRRRLPEGARLPCTVGVAQGGKSAWGAEAFGKAARDDIRQAKAGLQFHDAPSVLARPSEIVAHIDDQPGTMAGGELDQLCQIGDDRVAGRDRPRRGPVQPGAKDGEGLEHRRMGPGIDNDPVPGAKHCGQGRTDGFGTGGKGRGPGHPDKADDPAVQVTDRAAGFRGGPVPARRGHGRRPERRMPRAAEVVLRREIKAGKPSAWARIPGRRSARSSAICQAILAASGGARLTRSPSVRTRCFGVAPGPVVNSAPPSAARTEAPSRPAAACVRP